MYPLQFRDILRRLSSSLFVCARCGWMDWSGIGLFCAGCSWDLSHFETRADRARSWENGFLSRWLFEWNPRSESTVGVAIRALKGGVRTDAWRILAERWSSRALENEPIRPVFIPSPSRDGRRDHAAAFGAELARVWHARVEPCLVFPEGEQAKSQKALSVAERGERAFTAKYFPRITKEESLIFVDDVITTGSTVRAAYSALGRPDRFEAWALACRPKVVKYGDF